MNLNIWSGLSPYFPWWRSVKAPSWINISSPGVELPYSRVVLVLVLLELLTRDIQKWRSSTCEYQEYSYPKMFIAEITLMKKLCIGRKFIDIRIEGKSHDATRIWPCTNDYDAHFSVRFNLRLYISQARSRYSNTRLDVFLLEAPWFLFLVVLLSCSLSNLVFWAKRKSPVEL